MTDSTGIMLDTCDAGVTKKQSPWPREGRAWEEHQVSQQSVKEGHDSHRHSKHAIWEIRQLKETSLLSWRNTREKFCKWFVVFKGTKLVRETRFDYIFLEDKAKIYMWNLQRGKFCLSLYKKEFSSSWIGPKLLEASLEVVNSPSWKWQGWMAITKNSRETVHVKQRAGLCLLPKESSEAKGISCRYFGKTPLYRLTLILLVCLFHLRVWIVFFFLAWDMKYKIRLHYNFKFWDSKMIWQNWDYQIIVLHESEQEVNKKMA